MHALLHAAKQRPFYQKLSRKKYADKFEAIFPYIKPYAGDMLDFGCGDMQLSLLVARAFPGLRVTGCDVASYPHDAVTQVPNARFRVCGNDRLPFPDGQFDLSLASAALHHTADPDGALREISRVTKRGGTILIVEEYSRTRLGTRLNHYDDMIRNRILNPHVGGHLSFRTEMEWCACFSRLGLALGATRVFTPFPYFPVHVLFALQNGRTDSLR